MKVFILHESVIGTMNSPHVAVVLPQKAAYNTVCAALSMVIAAIMTTNMRLIYLLKKLVLCRMSLRIYVHDPCTISIHTGYSL